MTHPGPLLVVVGPLLAAVALWWASRRTRLAMGGAVAVLTALTFLGLAALTPAVLAHGQLSASVPALLGRLTFRLDGVGLLFALVASFAWTCSSLYAIDYLHHGGKQARYHLTSLLVFAAMLGIVTAGDLVTLYVFFEWLGLVAYLFVVHAGGPAAERAGLKYLVLTVVGGFAVLAGVLIAHSFGGGDVTAPLAFEAGREALRGAVAVLLLLGFGVKAGVLGLHVWLPDAHTAAPAPASALLSGVMIKAGAYGIVRTVGGLFAGGADPGAAAFVQGETLALAVLWLGAAGMLAGVAMALWQVEAKRLLAYSSVSQMGFVLSGIGAAGYLGGGGGIGWTGALLHVANHALFKGLLFLGIGAVIHATGVGDLRRLGGLARRMPWTFAFVLVAAAGIAGLPGLNGFVSKSVLHHALEYAERHAGLVSLAWAERVFTLTTFGTAAALTKLVWLTFLGRSRLEPERPVADASWRMRGAMAGLALAVVALGLWPQAFAPLLAGALASLGLPGDGVARWLASPIAHPGDLRAALTALAVGVGVHAVANATGAYRLEPPAWLSLDRAVTGAIGAGSAVARRWAVESAAIAAEVRRLAEHERDVLRRSVNEVEALADGARRSLGQGRDLLLQTVAEVEAEAEAEGTWLSHERRVWRVIAARLGMRRRRPRARLRPRERLERFTDRMKAARVLVVRGLRLAGLWLDESPQVRERADTEKARGLPQAAGRERWVLETRHLIQRETRDLSLNVGVLLVVWLLILAAVASGRGG